MRTAHLRTFGPYDEYDAEDLERIVRHAEGVKDVASIRSLRLISVLYDERRSSVSQLLRALQRAGYSARPYRSRLLG